MTVCWKMLSEVVGCEWVEGYRIGYDCDLQESNQFVIESCRARAYVKGQEGAVSVTTAEWHPLKLCAGKAGYLQCVVYTRDRRKTVQIHQVGYLAFGPARPSALHHVLHRDDVKTHNTLDNLYWGMARQNTQDSIRNGRKFAKGRSLPQTKINEQDAKEIYRRASTGESPTKIAKDYGITQPNVSMIKHKKSWRHIHGLGGG